MGATLTFPRAGCDTLAACTRRAASPRRRRSHMRRNVLISLATAALAWGVLAIALGSASLSLGSGSSSGTGAARASASPRPRACRRAPRTAGRSRARAWTSRRRREPTRPARTPRSASSASPAAEIHDVSRRAARAAALTRAACDAYSQGDGASFVPDSAVRRRRAVTVRAAIGAGTGGTPSRRSASASTPPTRPRTCRRSGNPPAAPADYQSFYTLPGVAGARS